jgi:predicted dehydrogenase
LRRYPSKTDVDNEVAVDRFLKAGVAGAGAFGGHHAKKYAQDPRTTLTAVFDVHFERAAALAEQFGAVATDDYADFLARCDIVTIATPAIAHATYARAALMVGLPTLVEKPLATTREAGAELVAIAADKNLALACGHQERLVFEAMGLFDLPERPTLIEAVRDGTWSGRGADVSVTLDLAVHDADLAMRLVDGALIEARATSTCTHSETSDTIEAQARFAGGAIVRLKASRVAPERRRTMRLVFPSGEVRIDFIARTFENSTPFSIDAGFAESEAGRDPLGANVARFIDAATGHAPRPAVTGAEALDALNLVLAIDAAAGA